MLNPNINYPYPVIRAYKEDYRTTVFEGALVVNLLPDRYLVRPDFQINNSGIKEFIEAGKLTYAIEIQSPTTWYRKLHIVKDNESFSIDPTLVHERVELTPCIIATTQIKAFTNVDFEEEYRGMTFDISAGDVIAIGEAKSFDALFQDDIIKHGTSPVTISRSDTAKEITCNFTGSFIEILLPSKHYDRYLECGYKPEKYKVLNAVLSIPALVEAIGIIANDENDTGKTSGFESKAWYKTIVVNLKRASENNDSKYRALLDSPFTSAELLLGNNYSAALEYLSFIE